MCCQILPIGLLKVCTLRIPVLEWYTKGEEGRAVYPGGKSILSLTLSSADSEDKMQSDLQLIILF